jgi:hypothetical protein
MAIIRSVSAVSALGVLLFTAGCGRMLRVATERARFEMNCPDVEVSELGGRAFGARGCGQQATYQCFDAPWVGIQCKRQSPAQVIVVQPPPPAQ